MYDLDGLAADPSRITDVATDDLAILLPHLSGQTVEGLDVVHLQCHIGTDTLSLARSGARMTGVDFSAESLSVARALAERAGLQIEYVESEVTASHKALGKTFDLVYTSIGTITWLPDLQRWAEAVVALLRPGGTFFIRDGHPMMYAIDFEQPDPLTLRHRYFNTGEPEVWDLPGTYTDGEASSITHVRTYEWPHPISEIISELIGVGLTIVHFAEEKTLPWEAFPNLIYRDRRFVLPPHLENLLPLTFSLVARKPV